jgi:hypothetical protein
LGSKHPNLCPGCNPEEVLRVAIIGMDGWTGKVVIKMFDFLVPGKEHQAPGAPCHH